MIVAVGSKNPVKVRAVEEVIKEHGYSFLTDAEILSYNVKSGVRDQPSSLDEMSDGAMNRARGAFDLCKKCNYSFGLESGIILASSNLQTHIDATVCAVYDGENFGLGLSQGIALPSIVSKIIFSGKRNLSEASFKSGLTDKRDLGNHEGFVGVLTKGKIDRVSYTKTAITMALARFDNPKAYAH